MTYEVEQIVDVLKDVGVNEKCALCLMALKESPGGATSLEIQKKIEMRQPDISVSLNALRENGWVDAALIRRAGRGRPHYMYSLTKPFDEIVRDIEAAEKQRIEMIEENLKRLNELTSQ